MTQITVNNHRKHDLKIIAVHGTFSGMANLSEKQKFNAEFYSQNSKFAKSLINKLSDKFDVTWWDFQWSGKNLESSRTQATRELKEFTNDRVLSNEKLLVLAHSHGGNVAQDWIVEHSQQYDAQLITFGTPFISVLKISPKNNEIAKNCAFLFVSLSCLATFFFLQEKLSPTAIMLLLLSFIFMLMILPFAFQFFRSWRRFSARKKTNHYDNQTHIICHDSDEAVALLNSKTKLDVSLTFLRRPMLKMYFVISLVAWMIIFYFALGGQQSDLDFAGQAILIAFMLAPIPALITTCIAFLLSFWVFGRKINSKVSEALSSVLWKLAKGEDTIDNFEIKKTPQISDSQFKVLDGRCRHFSRALKETTDRSARGLVKNKNKLFKALMLSGGDLISVLQKHSEISSGLVHCNYFTGQMATCLAHYTKELFSSAVK